MFGKGGKPVKGGPVSVRIQEQDDFVGQEARAQGAQQLPGFMPAETAGDDHLMGRAQGKIKGHQEVGCRGRILQHLCSKGPPDLRGLVFTIGIAGHARDAQQIVHGNGVARGNCPIIQLLLPHQQRLAILRGKEKSATPVFIPKMRKQVFIKRNRGCKVAYVKSRFVKLDQPPDQKGIVIKVGCHGGFSIAIAVQQPAVGEPQGGENKIGRSARCFGIGRFIKRLCRPGKRGYHQPVPVGKKFVVFMGMHPCVTSF